MALSRESIKNQVYEASHAFYKRSSGIVDMMKLTYTDFKNLINETNTLSEKYVHCEDKSKFTFEIESGSDKRTILWKIDVRVLCLKVLHGIPLKETLKRLNFKDFLALHHDLKTVHESVLQKNSGALIELPETSQFSSDNLFKLQKSDLDAEDNECIICLERQSDITLPCAHSYCQECIKKWLLTHKVVDDRSCPLCRSDFGQEQNAWLLVEKPDVEDSELNLLDLISHHLSRGEMPGDHMK